MKRISDREKVIDVYNDARFDRNRNEPVERQCSIYVGERQISDQCATPAKAWESAWEKIYWTEMAQMAAREASHGKRAE
jgi:hypothetical protein